MSFLNHLKIRNKLFLMVLFPMFGLLAFTILLIWQKSVIQRDMDDLQHLVELAVHISTTVHYLQKERDVSNFLLKEQAQLADDLMTERQHLDKAIQALQTVLTKMQTGHYHQKYGLDFDKIEATLNKISTIRYQVEQRTITAYEATESYTEINTFLIGFVDKLINFDIYKHFFHSKLAYLNVLIVKEKASLERVLLATVFQQRYFEQGQFQKFVTLVAKQEAYLHALLDRYTTAEQTAYIKSKLQSDYFRKTEKLRQLAYDASVDGVIKKSLTDEKGVTHQVAAYWFTVQTGKMEILRDIEQKLTNKLLTGTQVAKQQAFLEFVAILIITLALIILASTIVYVIFKGIVSRLTQAVSIAKAIAEGHLNNHIEVDVRDETGELLHAFKAMQNQLQIIIERDISNVLVAASQGNFQSRIDIENKSGVFKVFGENINEFMAFNHRIIQEIMQIFSALAKGDLSQEIRGDYRGDLEKLKNAFIDMQSQLKVVIEQDINNVLVNASQGNFQTRIDISNKSGIFKVFGENINEFMAFNHRMIEEIVKMFAALAEGDLNQKITGEYRGSLEQLKNDANTTVSRLTQTMQTIRQSAEQVSEAARQLSQSNTQFSQRTEAQAASLQQTSASMEEMTSAVQRTADNAKQANTLASKAQESAQEGGKVVGSAMNAMQEISESSQRVTDIISVINEIAFQTNLLALNASVEAARAGEQGRGFAVVAAEVRNLAQRSAEAAKEIKSLIQESSHKVEEGRRWVTQSGESLQQIVNAVKQVAEIISEIAAATQEQTSGIHQINRSIGQMEDTTQQNAALVEESASTSEAMSRQAQRLKQQVTFFKLHEE